VNRTQIHGYSTKYKLLKTRIGQTRPMRIHINDTIRTTIISIVTVQVCSVDNVLKMLS